MLQRPALADFANTTTEPQSIGPCCSGCNVLGWPKRLHHGVGVQGGVGHARHGVPRQAPLAQ
eukprot:11195047-Lingulodinium_polyedra.AAC.1